MNTRFEGYEALSGTWWPGLAVNAQANNNYGKILKTELRKKFQNSAA